VQFLPFRAVETLLLLVKGIVSVNKQPIPRDLAVDSIINRGPTYSALYTDENGTLSLSAAQSKPLELHRDHLIVHRLNVLGSELFELPNVASKVSLKSSALEDSFEHNLQDRVTGEGHSTPFPPSVVSQNLIFMIFLPSSVIGSR